MYELQRISLACNGFLGFSCVCIYIHKYIYMYVYIHKCVYAHVNTLSHSHIHMYIYTYIYILYIYIYTYMYIYMYVYIYVYTFICIYIYIQSYVYICIYIYMYLTSAVESFTSWHFQGPVVATNSNGGPSLDAAALLPSVLCAVEMALLQIVAQSMEVPLTVAAAALCHGSMPTDQDATGMATVSANRSVVYSHVYLNALLTRAENLLPSDGDLRGGPHLESAPRQERAQQSCSVVKIKVGGGSDVAQQAVRVRAIAHQASAQHQRVRLDANQCWTLPQV